MASLGTYVANGDVRLPVTRSGSGRKLIFFNGICAAQVIWKRVIARLTRPYEIITFDFRSHGGATPSADHSFAAFLSDAEAVMAAVGSDRPIVVAWSFGADVAVAYAAAHPGKLGGLVIVDGALPITETLVQDEPQMRRSLNSASMKFSMLLMKMTPYRYSLSGDDIADLTLTADAHRREMIGLYDHVDCPIVMLLAAKTSGADTTERARRNNALWRQAGERLAARRPDIAMTWIDAGHRLPLTRAGELASAIDAFARELDPAG